MSAVGGFSPTVYGRDWDKAVGPVLGKQVTIPDIPSVGMKRPIAVVGLPNTVGLKNSVNLPIWLVRQYRRQSSAAAT